MIYIKRTNLLYLWFEKRTNILFCWRGLGTSCVCHVNQKKAFRKYPDKTKLAFSSWDSRMNSALPYMLNYLNFHPHQGISHHNACIHMNFPPKLLRHFSAAVVSRMWHATCLECLSFRLHHFPRSISQHVPDISLLLQTGVSQPDLHTAPTTQTPSGTTSPHASSIFHSHMKYAWMCARHLPSLGFCSPQEARLICNWEVCWINQQFIHFLIETTLSKNTDNTENSTTDPSRIVFCLLSMLTNGPLRFREKLQWWLSERATKRKNILCWWNIVRLLCGECIWCFDLDFFQMFCCFCGSFVVPQIKRVNILQQWNYIGLCNLYSLFNIFFLVMPMAESTW